MSGRLPPQPGEWIDRSRRIVFRFEGEPVEGFAGDTVSSALWAAGYRTLGRSFKYHRPRGIYSLANHDINVLLEDDTRTNIRGDVEPIRDGMDLRAVNTSGGVRRDRLRWTERFARFMPVGFYYKAFHKPRWLFPFAERQMRRVAGLGRIKPETRTSASAKCYAHAELLVVGAGAAGLAAAVAAAEQGVDVVLAEEWPHPGGSLAWQRGGDLQAIGHRETLVRRAREMPNLRLWTRTQAAGCYTDGLVALSDPERLTKLRARAVVFATGAWEQPAVFAKNDVPGVLLASAAQRLMRLYGVKPCDRAAVLAANADGYRAARDLLEGGVTVPTVLDLRPREAWGECSRALAAELEEAGVTVRDGCAVLEARTTRDRCRLAGVVAAPIRSRGELDTGRAWPLDCDGLLMSVGWAPSSSLISQAGGRFRYEESVEQLVPASLPDSVFAAGRVHGIHGVEDKLEDGRRAGLAAARYLGREGPVPPAVEPRTDEPPSHPYPIFPHKKGKNFVDLDEDLHLADFVNAHQEGYDSVELLKRYTTVGMGASQGKLANTNSVRILARLNDTSFERTGTTTARPFYHPVPIGHLAGRRFHPLRRTPMHPLHEEAGARFAHAGAWLRPELYGSPAGNGATREDAVLREATCVRNAAGLIDVSTLGKIEVIGPDASTFLERIFTGRFAGQKPGRVQYALACDESGLIYEEALVLRLDDQHFYITSSSGGSAGFFRHLQQWQSIWGSQVKLLSSTGHRAAMNLAGPRAREVLAPLTGIDLSPDRLKPGRFAEGDVAGVPARVIGNGFVGGPSFELHLPARAGPAVWKALLDAGRPHDLRPFGTEAQRLLRLEMGHPIAGHDTDALTTPFEAGLDAVLAMDKPFFIGQRSLRILESRPVSRRLVGFELSPGDRDAWPEPCHLVIDGDRIAGRVTSFAARSTAGRPVGLAFVPPERTEPGQTFRIRLGNGEMLEARVAETPFYDPDERRQSGSTDVSQPS